MSSTVLRVGVIGCGDYGRRHIRRMGGLSGVQVVALADPSAENLERGVAELTEVSGRPPAVAAEDYRDVLAHGVDAVCIASPDAYHVDQVVASLEAGAHVLCEKPLTDNVAELERVLEARDRSGTIVAMTYQRRYDPAHRILRREILSGRWGAVTSVCVYNCEDWITPNRGTWRHDPAVCPGGFFYDASGHQLDVVFWLTGLKGEVVQAWVDNVTTPVPIRAWGCATLTGGVPMTFHFVGDADAWREQVIIHCEKRDFFVENMRPHWSAGKEHPAPFDIHGRISRVETSEPAHGPDVEFVQMIRAGLPNPAPPEDTRPVIQFTAAALRSASLRTPVSVPS